MFFLMWMFICILAFYYVGYGNEIDFKIRSTIDRCRHFDSISIPIITWCLNTTTPQKQVWQTRVLIQCWYGLSGVILFYFSYYSKYMNLLRNHFLQIYVLFLYTYGKTNESEKTLMRHIYKRFFFENWRTMKLCEKKERTSEQCHEFAKK